MSKVLDKVTKVNMELCDEYMYNYIFLWGNLTGRHLRYFYS
jgi:hypothetical protein